MNWFDVTRSPWDVISRNLPSSAKKTLRTSACSGGGNQRNLYGMRFRWKRGRPSCRKLLCSTCIAVLFIIVYKFIDEESSKYEKEWSCEELRAKELLIELVSNIFNACQKGKNIMYTKLIRFTCYDFQYSASASLQVSEAD